MDAQFRGTLWKMGFKMAQMIEQLLGFHGNVVAIYLKMGHIL
jgi:hypothetical protein